MNLKTYQQISELKSNILNSVKFLATDNVTPIELMALELLNYVKDVNVLEETFRKNTIKDHRELVKIAEDQFSTSEGISGKNFSHWQLVISLKAMLLSVTYSLLEDNSVRREEVASRLMGHVYCINQIEEGCIEYLEKTEIPRIYSLCEKIEDEIAVS
jgi:hypothetical protein